MFSRQETLIKSLYLSASYLFSLQVMTTLSFALFNSLVSV